MTQQKAALSPKITLLMAISAGVIIANIYYNQPILNNIAASIHASENEVGKIAVFSQLGFGVGIFFLLPLGDKLNRKDLIVFLTGALALMLVGFVLASSLLQIYILSFLIGLCSTPAQIILPMAATLDNVNRGKTVGKVFSGLLVGILGARVLSGLISDWLSDWRYVYCFSAAMVLIIFVLLAIYLPNVAPGFKGSYSKLLKSTLGLLQEHRLLRQASLLGACTFGVFCSFWTTFSFHLSAPPLGYPASTIGLFGLVAIGGALAAPMFGKLADKENSYGSLLMTVGMVIVSVVMVKIFPFSVPAMVVGIFFLDVGAQATQITNFARIYSLDQHAQSRLNTVYMTIYFLGAAIGTYFGVLCWKLGGWDLATSQMLLWGSIALLVVFVSEKVNTRYANRYSR